MSVGNLGGNCTFFPPQKTQTVRFSKLPIISEENDSPVNSAPVHSCVRGVYADVGDWRVHWAVQDHNEKYDWSY